MVSVHTDIEIVAECGTAAEAADVVERTLSPRESEVLHMLRDGLSNPAIASAMYISQSTAKTYVARLYDKLGAADRAQALMTAMRNGLISYEDNSCARPSRAAALAVQPARTTGSVR